MPATKQIPDRYSQDVLEFSRKHGITENLDIAVELMNQTFPEARIVTVMLEQDPESKHRWIMVDAFVQGVAKDIRLRHRECVRMIMKRLTWPTSTLIRTTYTLE